MRRLSRDRAEELRAERSRRRQARDFAGADALREELRAGGWEVLDSREGSVLREAELPVEPRAVTLLTLVHGWPEDAERWLASVLRACGGHDFEALAVDNSGDRAVGRRLAALAGERVRTLACEPPVGWAEAANRGLEAAAAPVAVLFDPGVELTGDVVGPLLETLARPDVAVAGAFGVRAEGRIGHFHAHPGPVVDAVEGYLLAFRREQALAAGGFDPRFRFYRLADFELCLRLRDRTGGRAVVLPGLPLVRHAHRLWEALTEEERERLSRRNYHRLMDRWGGREDLITR